MFTSAPGGRFPNRITELSRARLIIYPRRWYNRAPGLRQKAHQHANGLLLEFLANGSAKFFNKVR